MLAVMEDGTAAGENPYLVIRTCFLDQFLREATRDGLRQVVILAAGMDSRAFRMEWPPGTVIFEVEREEVLAYKASVLGVLAAAPRARRVEVPADLRDDFCATLRRCGFSEGAPAVFLLEGLTPYLPDEAAAMSILSTVASIAVPGSRLALDMVGQSFLRSPWTQNHLDRLRMQGIAWQFGDDHPEALLARAGFAEVTVIQPGEVGRGRWPYALAPRDVPGIPRTYFVVARR